MAHAFRLNKNNEVSQNWQPSDINSGLVIKALKRDFTGNEVIWRYLDLSKFIDLILTQKLHLTRTDYFEDFFEGELPLEEYLESMHNLLGQFGVTDTSLTRTDYHRFIAIQNKLQFFISCWHLNEIENYAMWKVYLSSNEGIAIKTTIKDLVNSITDPQGLFFDKVNYIDYNSETIKNLVEQYEQNGIQVLQLPCLYKRKYFEYEMEFRIGKVLVATLDTSNVKDSLAKLIQTAPTYEKFSLDLNKMNYSIYVSPFAGTWFGSLVKNLMAKLNIEKEIVVSNINEKSWSQQD
jgi:hypothetical protein